MNLDRYANVQVLVKSWSEGLNLLLTRLIHKSLTMFVPFKCVVLQFSPVLPVPVRRELLG